MVLAGGARYCFGAMPNLSGMYRLDVKRSDLGGMGLQQGLAMTRRVVHREPLLQLTTMLKSPLGLFEAVLNFHTSGRATTNQFRGRKVQSKAKWEGNSLKMISRMTYAGKELELQEDWTLSADGRTLTANVRAVMPDVESDQKMVFVRQ
jgi:hypothetical protein